ncbi:MAG: T9SS type A sorting domain-containing protein, partial [Bacteroidota bacterium]
THHTVVDIQAVGIAQIGLFRTIIATVEVDVTGVEDTLTIYVWDEANNFATCQVTILLSSCMSQSQANVAGGIRNEDGVDMNNVMVHLNGYMTEEQMTDQNGWYNFDDLPIDQNYSIRPEKDINPLNGVSTYDLVLISRHILGVELLDSPYKMIAADVNRSGSLTTFDLVELRKLILFIDTEFANNTSWRFIDAAFNFPLTNDPFSSSFPEIYNINGLSTNQQANFVAIKVGDVNGSAQASNFVASDERNSSTALTFELADQSLEAGQRYQLDFRAKDFAGIVGYQFSLEYEEASLQVEAIEGGALANLSKGNFGQLLGVLTTSWNNEQAISLSAEDIVFSLDIIAKKSTQLSEVLRISSAYTNAEAYQNTGTSLPTVQGVDLIFESAEGAFSLLQNRPNPFKDETTIGFYLPEASEAVLSIYDVRGRLVKNYRGDFAKGYNEFSINRAELGASGLLHYTLQSSHGTASKKMILLD